MMHVGRLSQPVDVQVIFDCPPMSYPVSHDIIALAPTVVTPDSNVASPLSGVGSPQSGNILYSSTVL